MDKTIVIFQHFLRGDTYVYDVCTIDFGDDPK